MGKNGPNATFNLIFLGLGWPWVGELVGFIIILVCFPTQPCFGKSQTPCYDGSQFQHLFLLQNVSHTDSKLFVPKNEGVVLKGLTGCLLLFYYTRHHSLPRNIIVVLGIHTHAPKGAYVSDIMAEEAPRPRVSCAFTPSIPCWRGPEQWKTQRMFRGRAIFTAVSC